MNVQSVSVDDGSRKRQRTDDGFTVSDARTDTTYDDLLESLSSPDDSSVYTSMSTVHSDNDIFDDLDGMNPPVEGCTPQLELFLIPEASHTIRFYLSKNISLEEHLCEPTFEEFAQTHQTPVDLLCSYNDARPHDSIRENSCILLPNELQHKGYLFTLKLMSHATIDAEMRTMLRAHCSFTQQTMREAFVTPHQLMSAETHQLAQQYARTHYVVPHEITLQEFSEKGIFKEIDWYKVYRENNDYLRADMRFKYPATVSIGTKEPDIRPLCLLDIIHKNGQVLAKGKVLGSGEQLRKNLYMNKINLLSRYNGQVCTLPLKHTRSNVPNTPQKAHTIHLTLEQQDDMKARFETVPFYDAKTPCLRNCGNQGHLYSTDLTEQIGKFTKNATYTLYTYFAKPYTVRLIHESL